MRSYPDEDEYSFFYTYNLWNSVHVPGLSEEQRAVYARRHADLMMNDETTGAWAAAVPISELILIQERVSHIVTMPALEMTPARRSQQRGTEWRKYADLVNERHEAHQARVREDLALQVSNVVMNAQRPADVLGEFVRNVEARVYAHMQTALPIGHEDYGRAKKPKTDKN